MFAMGQTLQLGAWLSVEDITKSASSGNLVVVLGAGSSISLTAKSKRGLSWVGLVRSALEYGHERGLVSEAQYFRNLDVLSSDDIDDLLGVAEFVGRKMEAPEGFAYARWMRATFDGWKPEPSGMQNALRAMEAQKIRVATLNYDTLIEGCTGLTPIDFGDTQATMAWVRKEREGVLHLHGVWTNPNSCVFGIRDYQATLSDEIRHLVQRSLSSLNQMLFVGCGDTFADPNFSALIAWLRRNLGANVPQHYALVRDDEVKKRLAEPAWRGFVEPLGYGPNYTDLPGFLLRCFPTRHSPKTSASKEKAAAGRDSRVLEAYRSFLLRDCGEMTIEGMRADMDTAQRKFDLENLFVPLEVGRFPPDVPVTDPNREAKLEQWRLKHSDPIAFANAFEKTSKIALLALPGGGKTLLLKRLAVAYANPSRRQSSDDNLPELDLLPVMIRCREWKEHIRKPIQTLLRSIANITGEEALEELADALQRPLKAGSVLLLVDGLDEIHDDADRSIFVENLERFIDTYPKIRVVVTSREAGFDLVAPCLVRFCTKFKIAPLSENAIGALCRHWHHLMSGGTPEALAEAATVQRTLIKSDSLRRLAENPLLLTMLLVVKHGAGRLPPDRVSLYDRAVEVLLDTWNIKGHEALNVKEAVPQLACLAFELLRQGKQTATEREILDVLEEARVKLSMVGRYAKDSPHDFLKRVELRSSLLLQGGHTSENGKTVPFYQFRHLTFQEYLAAVAAVEGYNLSGRQNDLPLSALGENLISDEWKEVIPMAAMLARNQATPLLSALLAVAETEKQEFLQRRPIERIRLTNDMRLPPATGRLAQSMIEEAIFSSDIVDRAVHAVAFFANGCRTNDNWQALARGPYGPDLRDAALSIYLDDALSYRVLAKNTVAILEAYTEPSRFWTSDECEDTLLSRLKNHDIQDLCRTILSISGSFWLHRKLCALARSQRIYQALENALFDERPPVQGAAAWSWGFWRHLQISQNKVKPIPNIDTVNRLVYKFFDEENTSEDLIRFAVADLVGVERGSCKLELDRDKSERIRSYISSKLTAENFQEDLRTAVARVAFILPGVCKDDEISKFILRNNFNSYEEEQCEDIYRYLGLGSLSKRRSTRRGSKG